MRYVDVQEGRIGTEGTVMPDLGDPSVSQLHLQIQESLKAGTFFFPDRFGVWCWRRDIFTWW